LISVIVFGYVEDDESKIVPDSKLLYSISIVIPEENETKTKGFTVSRSFPAFT